MIEQCAAKKVPFATIFSSGFAEAGEDGRRVQRQVTELAAGAGIRICGPNCQGAVDLFHSTAAAFSASLDPEPFRRGPVGFVTQSGALGYSIFNMAQESGIGFSYVVSTGNEMDLDCGGISSISCWTTNAHANCLSPIWKGFVTEPGIHPGGGKGSSETE